MHDTQKAKVRLVRSVREGFLGMMRDVLWHLGVLKKKARFCITTGGNLLYPRQQTMMVVNFAKRARVQRERERERERERTDFKERGLDNFVSTTTTKV